MQVLILSLILSFLATFNGQAAAVTCAETHQTVQRLLPAQIEDLDWTSLHVSDAFQKEMAKRISKLLKSEVVNSMQLQKTTERFFEILQGGFFQKYIRALMMNHNRESVALSEQFIQELRQKMTESGVEIKDSFFTKLHWKVFNNRRLISWIHFIAVHASINLVSYTLFDKPVLIYFPRLSIMDYQNLSSFSRKAFFYERFADRGLTAIWAALFALAYINEDLTVENLSEITFNIIMETQDKLLRLNSAEEQSTP